MTQTKWPPETWDGSLSRAIIETIKRDHGAGPGMPTVQPPLNTYIDPAADLSSIESMIALAA